MDYNCNWMFLLTISVLVFVTPLHCSNVPFRSKKSPSGEWLYSRNYTVLANSTIETIQDYEVIVPEISFSSERSKQVNNEPCTISLCFTFHCYYSQGHPKTIKVSLQSTRDIYYLNLHLNE